MSDPEQTELEGLRAEVARLQEADALWRASLAATPDFISHITPTGELLYLNRLAPGFSLESVIGTTVFNYVDPAHHERTRVAIERAAAGEPQEYVVVGQGANGEPRHYLTKIQSVSRLDGIESLIMTATDVSAVEIARETARRQRAQLELAVEATKLGIWTTRPPVEGELSGGTWDAATRRVFGYGEDEALTPTPEMISERIHPEDAERVQEAVRRAFETLGDYTVEHRTRWPDGTVRHVLAQGRVWQEEGKPPQLIGSVLDITERKQLEARLAESQKLESIGRLAGGIAHDFNNLLTTITTAGYFAQEAVGPGSEAAEYIADVLLAAERSAALTRQLLAFARRQVFEPRVVDPNELTKRVEALLRRILGEHVNLRFAYEARGRLRVDPSQLEQVLLNLATNARDAMPEGGELSIRTADLTVDEAEGRRRGGLPAGAYVSITVRDTGAGIAASDQPHVFEPFFSTKGSAGTGLGLATCYGITRQNGGSIRVESELGSGSTFELLLPRTDAQLEVHSDAAPAARSTERATVLLVEDEDAVRRLMRRVLVRGGHEVIEATDGVEGLERSRQHEGEIDLLLSDVVMPRLGGLELAAQLRSERPKMAVIFTSGYAEQAITHDGRVDEGVRFLPKPFLPSDLLEKIREALSETRSNEG